MDPGRELNPFGSRTYANVGVHKSNTPAHKLTLTPRCRFAAGQLTIVNFSDPFIDPASACGLFEIIRRLFVRAEDETGKVMKPARYLLRLLFQHTFPLVYEGPFDPHEGI